MSEGGVFVLICDWNTCEFEITALSRKVGNRLSSGVASYYRTQASASPRQNSNLVQFIFSCGAVTLLKFTQAPPQPRQLLLTWDELLYFLLTDVCVIRHRVTVVYTSRSSLKFVATKILLRLREQMVIAWRRFPLIE
jgi:hypothetical protein